MRGHYPLQITEVTARAAVMEFFVRFGYPFEMFMDHGRKYNCTLMDTVCCYIDNQVKSWNKHLGILAEALQSAVNRQTGYTPDRIMLRSEVNSPTNLQFGDKSSPGGIRSK